MSNDLPTSDEARLDALNQQLAKASQSRASDDAPNHWSKASKGIDLAYRLVAEMVAAVAVGCAFGYGFDYLVKTSPWGLIIGLMLGFTAGVVNLMRSTQTFSKGVPLGQDLPPQPDGED